MGQFKKYHFAIIVTLLTGCTFSPIQQELDYVHHRFVYEHDLKQYGKRDWWAASYRGDCEDFALVLQRRLADRGIAAHLVRVIAKDLQGHIVLMVDGKALDINHKFPFTLESAGYRLWDEYPVAPNEVK